MWQCESLVSWVWVVVSSAKEDAEQLHASGGVMQANQQFVLLSPAERLWDSGCPARLNRERVVSMAGRRF